MFETIYYIIVLVLDILCVEPKHLFRSYLPDLGSRMYKLYRADLEWVEIDLKLLLTTFLNDIKEKINW